MTDDRPQALRTLPPEFLTLVLALYDFSYLTLADAADDRMREDLKPGFRAAAEAAGLAAVSVHRMANDASARRAVDDAMTAIRAMRPFGVLEEVITADLAVRERLWKMDVEPEAA